MTAIDLSGAIGLTALYLLTANILLGLLLSVRYNPWTHWPHRRINYFRLHNWTGYLALAVAALHPTVLLFSSTAGFTALDLVYPIHSPTQPLINTLGACAFYLLAFVVVTSYFRPKLNRRLWKKLHYVAYATALLFFVHGIWTDPTLEGEPLNPIDAEKVSVELCALIVIVATVLRVRAGMRRRAARPAVAARRPSIAA